MIEIVNTFTYLGIVFTCGGSVTKAQTMLAGQAQKAIFKLNKYLYKFTYIKPRHKLNLFDTLITPILNYGSEIMGFTVSQTMERVHLQFCKKILGVKKTTQNDFIYGELGRISFHCRHLFNIVKFWMKILCSNENKYVSRVYKLLKSDFENNPNIVNWCSKLKQLLCSLGFYDVWLQQSVGDIDMFLAILKQRLKDNFVQNWHERLHNSSRALFYRTIANFEFQSYLDIFNANKLCQAMVRLRVSSHRLQIEAGRWSRPTRTPVNERKCLICNVLEDEYHFILECSMYTELRKQFIHKKYWKHPNMVKFIELLNNENDTNRKKLGIFVYKSFEKRNEMLYGSVE